MQYGRLMVCYSIKERETIGYVKNMAQGFSGVSHIEIKEYCGCSVSAHLGLVTIEFTTLSGSKWTVLMLVSEAPNE
jgi:hypothetical protein